MPRGPVSLVVTDLDGTLWHTEEEIAPSVVAAMAELERRGVPLLIATGRRLASTRRPLARVGLRPPAVVLNGALGVDLATGDRFHRAPFDAADAVTVHDRFVELGLQPVVHVDHPEVDAFLGPEPSTNPAHARALLAAHSATGDLAAVVADLPVLGFSLIGVEHRTCVAARDATATTAETHLDRSLDYPGLATLTVAPHGQSKWDGVRAFCAARGLDPARVLALGDGSNDLELLDGAAVALVPAVAHPAALERADHVIPSAADAGWVAVLDHV
ncbi:HAD family phosphatase [Iamia sp. SCSIO 61187]|uniref:HAD family hydrolase n=1 Tax=Iamia sp. SCSIO 61187 TaxID=2722752 RepID=UPI001C63A35C|nr:HAD family hydrolase [Iamia sp. SCSIO 61187]QYG92148.1 HAD family phosphatase [Iamia sp. SCSIO 61187]